MGIIRMGVVADDITGSNDIGIMFAKAGYRTRVYNFESAGDFLNVYQPHNEPEVVILNTNSRLDEPQIAYQKVFNATLELQNAGCQQFHNKTCSVFRGNIGAEFDAMLDALNGKFALVVLGFPKNGRTTLNGLHYVRGVPLHESEFKNDPVHPMRESALVNILQSQTQRKVSLITHGTIANGADAIQAQINEQRDHANYLILDVADQDALATIAEAIAHERVICGSSAIAEELPAVWRDDLNQADNVPLEHHSDLGVLCAAGSLMPQTAAQIDFMRKQGTAVFTLDTTTLFTQSKPEVITTLVDVLVNTISNGHDAVLHSANHPDDVAKTRALGQEKGYTPTQISRLVSTSIADIVAQVLERTGQNRLLIAGGETSDAVCKRLNINGLQIHREIQPGLPSCFSLTDQPLLLVLKSGSFGTEDFFLQAFNHLKDVR